MPKKKKKDILEQIVNYLTERAEKFTDRITVDDVFKSVSILSVAMIIQSGIRWTEHAVANIKVFPGGLVYRPDLPPIEERTKIITPFPEGEKDPAEERKEWIISLGLAYLIVTHFGEIVKSTSEILQFARNALGVTSA